MSSKSSFIEMSLVCWHNIPLAANGVKHNAIYMLHYKEKAMQYVHDLISSISCNVLCSWLFIAGALFYAFRLCNPGLLKTRNGYFDAENEFWHAACLLGMVACLNPALLPVPPIVWTVLFPIGTIWYLIRAFTYGQRLPYNKLWYDLAHAAMLFGMWWMLASPVQSLWFTVIFTCYWTWFGSYYAVRLYQDCKKPQALSIGQDFAHFAMALVMVLMTASPTLFMPEHHHSKTATNIVDNVPEIISVADADFDSTVLNANGQVVLLIFGGCENCSLEARVFNGVAEKMKSSGERAKFVRMNKEDCPKACTKLKVDKCPKVLIVSQHKVVATLDGFADQEELLSFLSAHLNK